MTIFINKVRLDEIVDSVDESLFFHSTSPKRAYEEVTIPGRDGVLHLDQKRFEPYTLSIPVYFRTDFKNRYRQLLNLLNGLSGTVEVKCTPAPVVWGEGHYEGIFYGAIPAPDTGSWLHSGKVTIQFQCNPRWWLDMTENTWFLPLELYSGNANYQAKTLGKAPAKLWDYSTTVVADSFPNILSFIDYNSNNYSRSDLTIVSDTRGCYVNMSLLLPTGGNGSGHLTMRFSVTDARPYYLEVTDPYTVGGTSILRYEIAPSFTLTNYTTFTAKPLFKFCVGATGSTRQAITLTINNIEIVYDQSITDFVGDVYIDCDIQDCYYISGGVRYNANQYLTITDTDTGLATTDFPVLNPGDNTITTTRVTANPENTTGSYIEIYPRWYLI